MASVWNVWNRTRVFRECCLVLLGGVWVELRCLLGACFLFGGAPPWFDRNDVKPGGLVCVWKWGCRFFFGRKLGWAGRGYILPMLCRAKIFFFRFCREYPQMDLGSLKVFGTEHIGHHLLVRWISEASTVGRISRHHNSRDHLEQWSKLPAV